MIRLKRPATPTVLAKASGAATKRLWDAWREEQPLKFDEKIYGHKDVKAALLAAQHGKCAYCETKLTREYGRVEHFRPKSGWQQRRGHPVSRPGYFWLAYTWDNLCVSCEKCNDNGHKGTLFPLANPGLRTRPERPDTASERPLLLNPYADDPDRHIAWEGALPVPRRGSRRGRETIDVFKLDRDEALVDDRRWYLQLLKAAQGKAQTQAAGKQQMELLKAACLDCKPYAAMARATLASRLRELEAQFPAQPCDAPSLSRRTSHTG